MEEKLSKELKERLEKYPALKGYVENFIQVEGMNPNPDLLTPLTVYIRKLDIDVPSFFDWDDETTDYFYTWGHNSRYAHVFEPRLWYFLEDYLSLLIDWFDEVTSDKDYQEDKELINLIKNGMEEE
jgi:hypothetical protein